MTQRTTSSMVEVLKNKTVPWLVGLPEEKKGPIINLARKRAATVIKEDKEVSEEHYRQRKEARLEAMQKGAMKVAREQDRQNELSKIRRISTPAELREIIEQTGAFKDKRNETEAITIIKEQMALRGKRLQLTRRKQKRTLEELHDELTDIIRNELEQTLHNSAKAVGLNVEHNFKDVETGSETWYKEHIVSCEENSVEIKYEGDDEIYSWTISELMVDIDNTDLKLFI